MLEGAMRLRVRRSRGVLAKLVGLTGSGHVEYNSTLRSGGVQL